MIHKTLFSISLIFLFIFIISCEKDKKDFKYDVTLKIDSIKQDTRIFSVDTIPDKVNVYFSLINNDVKDLHCFKYSLYAFNDNYVSYQRTENHYHVVRANSKISDSTKIGVGPCWVLPETIKFDNISFE